MIDGYRPPNKTGKVIKQLLEEANKPMHLNQIAKATGKTKDCCYIAIHREPETFERVQKATYKLR